MIPEKLVLWGESRSPIDDYPELILDEHLPLLRAAIWVMMVGSLLFMGLVLEFSQEHLRRVYAAGSLFVLATASLAVLKCLGPTAALRLLAFGGWILATGASIGAEGVRTPVLIAYPVILVFTGWLLGARYCLIVFAASCVAVVAMAYAQHSGVILAVAPLPPLIVAVAFLIVLSISAAMTLYLLRVFQKRFAEANQLNATLQASETRFRDLLQSVPAVAVQGYGEDGTTRYWNHASELLYGYSAAEAIGRNRRELVIPPEMHQDVEASMRQMFEKGQPIPAGELSLMRKDGSRVHVFSSNSYVHVPGQAPEMFCLDIDLSERQQMEVQVRQLAFYDSLTGLPNRRLLSDRLNQAMAAHKRSRCHGALMFLDLDNFKPLNDVQGHEVGDLLLVEVAGRLKGCVREMDTVARFGGDEFVVLISELAVGRVEALSEAAIIAEKIRATLANPYMLNVNREGKPTTAVEHRCTVSIGVALFVDNEDVQDEILRRADSAMYQAKGDGRNAIRSHEPTG